MRRFLLLKSLVILSLTVAVAVIKSWKPNSWLQENVK